MARRRKDSSPVNLSATEPEAGTRVSLSRRAFIGSSAGSMALASDIAFSEDAPKVERLSDEEILITPAGANEEEQRWRIRRSDFEGVDLDLFTIADGWRIRLGGVLPPQYCDTDLSARFLIEIVQSGGSWIVRIKWRGAVLVDSAPLQAWCRGDAFPIKVTMPSIKLDRLVVTGTSAKGTFDKRFAFSLLADPGRPFRFTLTDQAAGQAMKVEIAPSRQFSSDAAAVLAGQAASAGTKIGLSKLTLDTVAAANAINALWRDTSDLDGARRRALAENAAGAVWPIGRVDAQLLLTRPDEGWIFVESVKAFAARSVITLESRAAGRMTLVDRDSRQRIRLAEGARYTRATHLSRSLLRVGVNEQPHAVAGEGFSAQIRHGGMVVASLNDGVAERIELPAQLLTFHTMTSDGGRCDLDLRRPRPVAPGQAAQPARLDSAAIRSIDTRLDGESIRLTIGTKPTAGETQVGNHIHLGRSGRAILNLSFPKTLDQPLHRLRLRRHLDGLDLSFAFDDHRLEVNDGNARLVPGPNALRAARFWPQHVQEEVFIDPKPAANPFAVAINHVKTLAGSLNPPPPPDPCGEAGKRELGKTATFGAPNADKETLLARTRVSGESRIVLAPLTPAGEEVPLTIAALTNWSKLALRTPPRARGDLDIDKQIEDVVGIRPGASGNPNADRAAAIDKIRATLVAPGEKETALELVTGLVFSPEHTARFRTPRQAPSGSSARLWSAQIDLDPIGMGDNQAPARVRAIWSRGFDPVKRVGGDGSASSANGPFATSLSAQDRDEIVMLSSAFGVAALRAVTLAGGDVPTTRVRRPRQTFGYLSDHAKQPPIPPAPADAPRVLQEGVYSPAPFEKFDARLTAFGADLDLEWRGEPPANYPAPDRTPPVLPRALNIEHYIHRANLGSDVLVEVVYKGFLFPHGFRVSLIKVTEREQHKVGDLGWTMPLVQRLFILPKDKTKLYDGPFAPYAGHEVPMRWAKLVQKLSPEIEDPKKAPFGLPDNGPQSCGARIGRVFWPIARGQSDPLQFEYMADDTGVLRAAPMIFVDNEAAHDEATMRTVVNGYNQLFDGSAAERALCREFHRGGRTIYAAPGREGDTSFPTDHILLGARGRLSIDATSGAETESFAVDAFMEGDDQPPFFPVMREAAIKVEQVDRLLQQPQRFRKVGFDSTYIRHGFDKAANPGELYLRFLESDGLMQVAGKGSMSGGVAQTPTPLAGISRANAVVGGRLNPRPKPGAAPALLPGAPAAPVAAAAPMASTSLAVGADTQSPWNLDSVKAGRFDPMSYFKLGKLLGILDLGDVVKAALISAQPKLVEVFDYAESAAGQASGVVRDALRAAERVLDQVLGEANANIGASLPGLPGGAGPYPNLSSLYPELTARLVSLKADLIIARDAPAEDFFVAAGRLVNQWGPLKREIDRIADHPTPAIVDKTLVLLRQYVTDAEAEVRRQFAFLRTTLRTQLRQRIERLFAEKIVDAGLFELAFAATGQVRATLKPDADEAKVRAAMVAYARQMVADISALPQEARDKLPRPMRDALLADGLILPLIDMLAKLDLLGDAIESLSISKLAEAFADAARATLEAMLRAAAMRVLATYGQPILCNAAGGGVSLLASIARAAKAPVGTLAAAIGKIEPKLDLLGLPSAPDGPEVSAVRTAGASLRVAVQRLARETLAIKAACEALEAATPNPCANPTPILEAASKALRARAAAIEAAEDCARQVREVEDAFARLAGAATSEGKKALEEIRRALAEINQACTSFAAIGSSQDWRDLAQAATRLVGADAATAARIRAAQQDLEQARLAFDQARQAIPAAGNVLAAELLSAFNNAARALVERERALLFSLVDGIAAATQLLDEIEALALSPLAALCPQLIGLHQNVEAALALAVTKLREPESEILRLLAGPTLTKLEAAAAQVAADRAALQTLQSNLGSTGKAIDPLKAILDGWRANGPGLVRAARLLNEIVGAIAQGKLSQLIDLASARRAIEAALEQIIPTKVTLTYSWDAALGPFPASNPIFMIPPPMPVTDTRRLTNDLVISTKVVVDLKNGGRTVDVVGQVRPFAIHLLGNSIDLVTIGFTNARFEVKNGGSPSFKVDIAQVQIGSLLEFLNTLSEYLGGNSGVYIAPSFAPPGVEVGYAFSSPIIPMGTLTFMNVAFSTGIHLPFTDQPALFRAALASRELPFRVLATPYTGAGFFSMLANAKGIVAFEIQLEFGAAVALNFSPLRAWGYVSAGFYLFAQSGGSRIFEGFVHAMGEGSIACFGVTVNIEVRMRQEKGSMKGSSRYKFTFRVGFASFSYSFQAKYNVQGGGPGGGGSANSAVPDNGTTRAAIARPPEPAHYPYTTVLPDKRCWREYSSHFVKDWK